MSGINAIRKGIFSFLYFYIFNRHTILKIKLELQREERVRFGWVGRGGEGRRGRGGVFKKK